MFQAAVVRAAKDLELPSGNAYIPAFVDDALLPALAARIAAYADFKASAGSVDTVKTAYASASKAIQDAEREASTGQTRKTKAKQALDEASDALSMMDSVRETVMTTLIGMGDGAVSPALVQAETVTQIEALCSTAGLAGSDCAIGDTRAGARIVAALPTPQAAPFASPGLARARTAKEALDDIIVTLQAEQLRVIREQGAGSKNAIFVQEALDAAERQRSDQIYVRPAISYLRTSYASDFLGDNAVRWRNLLEHQLYRSIPIAGKYIENEESQKLSIIETSDRQFWQNVNQVRVSGGGRTDYVVTKDDIGNWYVRRFSASPDAIIESMSNLAKYTAGLPASELAQSSGVTRAAPAGSAERVLEQRKESYRAATAGQYSSLQGKLAQQGKSNFLAASVISAWKGDVALSGGDTPATTVLEPLPSGDPLNILTDAAASMDTKVKKAAEDADTLKLVGAEKDELVTKARVLAYADGLRAMNAFARSLAAKVSGAPGLAPAKDGNPAQAETANKVMQRVVGEQMKLLVDERQRTLDDLKTTSTVLAESMSQD